MPTRRANRLRNTVQIDTPAIPAAAPAPAPVDLLDPIRVKFSRLAEIRATLASLKALYEEHDRLQEELLPSFITRTATGFEIKNQITVGNNTYRLHPAFFDVSKNKFVAKTWKSAASPTMIIEG